MAVVAGLVVGLDEKAMRAWSVVQLGAKQWRTEDRGKITTQDQAGFLFWK
jgi:hypothetical protein